VLYAIAATCGFFVCLHVCLFVFSQLVCFQVLLVALRLDSPQRPWIVFCLVFTGVAAGCLVFHCLFLSISVPFLCSSSLWRENRFKTSVRA